MPPRVAVVGHVEWAEFAVVTHLPGQGEILRAASWFEEAAGGGAVAAVQLARLAGSATFFTALAEDEHGRTAAAQLAGRDVAVHAGSRPAPHRRAFVFLEPGERTIVVLGERIVPHGDDALPWELLGEMDGVYFTGGDAGALRACRAAKRVVATPRVGPLLVEAGVRLDALVHSANDPGEALDPASIQPQPEYVVSTLGAKGGEWRGMEGVTGTWEAAELPGPVADSYGCGDSFAAGLTYGLAAGWPIERAVRLAAKCGAYALCGRGPYRNQLATPG